MNDENELFHQAVSGIRPLATDKVPVRRSKAVTPGQEYRREAARRLLDDDSFLPTSFIEPLAPYVILEYRRPGVQEGVFRKLRRGEYPIEALLDLHNITVAQARREVYQFVQNCLRESVRCALIIHGKGSQQSPGLLKGCLARWLPMLGEVLAFHSAQKHHGGGGAVYLLLKKSAIEKERNRRRFQLAER
ncbi:MAG TPA: DNA endonuclease SmrA [Methylothermaceae bacterium]|nr:DNA endonuclease SmrA [Methylothermaceae bacterium]